MLCEYVYCYQLHIFTLSPTAKWSSSISSHTSFIHLLEKVLNVPSTFKACNNGPSFAYITPTVNTALIDTSDAYPAPPRKSF